MSRWSLLVGVYLATLLPATTLCKHGYDNGGADRYAHLPSLALVIPTYAALCAALRSRRRHHQSWVFDALRAALVVAVVAAALAGMCRLTRHHTEAWRDGRVATPRGCQGVSDSLRGPCWLSSIECVLTRKAREECQPYATAPRSSNASTARRWRSVRRS